MPHDDPDLGGFVLVQIATTLVLLVLSFPGTLVNFVSPAEKCAQFFPLFQNYLLISKS